MEKLEIVIDIICLTVLGHTLFVNCIHWLAPCIHMFANHFVRDFLTRTTEVLQ